VLLRADEELQLAAGDWLYLDRGQEHSVSALQDSSLLVTIMFEQTAHRPR
jgi:quercetin dioxygenase-like cupin family protein